MKNIGNLFVRLFVIPLLTFRYFSTMASLFGAGAAPFFTAPVPIPTKMCRLRRLRLRIPDWHYLPHNAQIMVNVKAIRLEMLQECPALLGGAHFTQLFRWFVSSQVLLYCIRGRRHILCMGGGGRVGFIGTQAHLIQNLVSPRI